MILQRLCVAGAALCFAAALAGCGGNTAETGNTTPSTNEAAPSTSSDSAPSTEGATSLAGAGATFPAPLYTKWFDTYNKAKNVKIDYQSVGSGAGIKQLTAQTVDFGASDAPLNDKEKGALPAPAVTLPTVAGAVVLAYNVPGAPKNLKMTGDAIAKIYLGTVKTWNDPAIAASNPGVTLPATKINVAHRSDGSGTSYIFTNFLASASNDWKTKVGAGKSVDWPTGIGGKGNDGVASAVKSAPGGIGYVELAYAKQNGLPYASVQNKDGQFVEPTVDATTATAEGALADVQKDVTAPIANAAGAKAYPIAGFTYLMVYQTPKNAAKGAALKEFLKWAMTDGQKDAAALDYAPLPKSVADLNLKTIDGLK
ncbi:phosphate ABC transporter substrate-binding protein PstS [bacterium]|nr:MAG: phosphate ABC transporter substrate-binding protein PstS [bacterium]